MHIFCQQCIWPVFGSWGHPKAGRNTLFQHFRLCHVLVKTTVLQLNLECTILVIGVLDLLCVNNVFKKNFKGCIDVYFYTNRKQLKTKHRNSKKKEVESFLTSFWVHSAPKSWSKTQHVSFHKTKMLSISAHSFEQLIVSFLHWNFYFCISKTVNSSLVTFLSTVGVISSCSCQISRPLRVKYALSNWGQLEVGILNLSHFAIRSVGC